jgi:hypothetical protein
MEEKAEVDDILGTYFFGAPLDVEGSPLFTRSLSITCSVDKNEYTVLINGIVWGQYQGVLGTGPLMFSDGKGNFLYISLCLQPESHRGKTKFITITYFQYDLPGDPAATGVWLGMSNPPAPRPRPRTDRDY